MPSSIHSGISGTRSIGSLASTLTTRSRKSVAGSQLALRVKWWQRRPIIKTAYFLDLQKGSYAAAIFTLVQSILLLFLSLFDLYCLIEARPGSRHFRSFGFSFLFVYSGNRYIRLSLILTCIILALSAIVLMISSIIIIPALKKEKELKFRPWLMTMVVFIGIRAITIIFQSIANDLYFNYHRAILLLWLILIPLNVFALLVVYSNYQELSDITKIEDMANLKMSTLSSLQGSRAPSHSSIQSLDSYRHYGATINSNPSPSYMRAAANINHLPYATSGIGLGSGAASAAAAGGATVGVAASGSNLFTGSIYGGSNLSTPTPSILAHHASNPSLRGGTTYTIPLEMFDLNRPGSRASSNLQINQKFM